MNRLKAYVRRTILASATDGAWPKKRRTEESTLAAFRDAAHGTDTGWWSDLIYTQDVVRMASRYRGDIGRTIHALTEECGASPDERAERRHDADAITYGEVIVSSRAPITMDDYDGTNGFAAERGAEALCLGLRIAVELLVHDVAREEGVDL